MIPTLFRLIARRVFCNPLAPLRIGVLLAAVLFYGSSGFLFFELPENPALTWGDSIWYSVVTVTTVGYGDLYPSTFGGRVIVAMPLMFFGIGLLGYLLSVAASALVEAKTKEAHGMANLKLKDHLIVLNYPGLGKLENVLDELAADPAFGKSRDVALIDENLTELPPELVARDVHYVRGNPSRDETLARASIDDAAYAIVLSRLGRDPRSDDQNVVVALAIEARAPKVHTVVECVDAATEELLKKAGSDCVVCTSRFDAHFVSAELLNPGVQEVIAQLTSNLRGQQIYVTRFAGSKTVAFTDIEAKCRELAHIALGVQKDGKTTLNVDSDQKVVPGDGVITMGASRLAELS